MGRNGPFDIPSPGQHSFVMKPRSETGFLESSDLLSRPEVKEAREFLRAEDSWVLERQLELTAIPAPPFGEEPRGRRMAELFREVGGFTEGVDGSQDYDLFLKLTERARIVEHVPKILYHWRMIPGSAAGDSRAKGGAWRESSKVALAAAIQRRGWNATWGRTSSCRDG